MDKKITYPKKMLLTKPPTWFVEFVEDDPQMSMGFINSPWCGHMITLYIVDKEDRIHGKETFVFLGCYSCQLGGLAKTKYCAPCKNFFCVPQPSLPCICKSSEDNSNE